MILYPPARWLPIASHGGPVTARRGLVEHITTNDASPYGFFANPANQASSHLWIASDGSVQQYVSLDLASWAQAGGNYGWTSVEISGKPGTFKTPAQVEALARLFAWGHTHPSLLWPVMMTSDPNGAGLGWHGMGGIAWGNHPDCPGNARRSQTPAVLARARQLLAPPAPPQHVPILNPYRRDAFAFSVPTVRWIQWAVGVIPDGIIGPLTIAAVKRFQTTHHLVPDGIAGPLTKAQLQLVTR
jgi:peptidoglycan hydrolase-like protein with peptidoglycan-binding domain